MKRMIGLSLIAILALSGCAKKSENEISSNWKIGGEITVVTDRTDADEIFAQVEEKFKKKYPDVVDIKWESSADYDTHITTRMNTKEYGDVLFIPFSLNATPQEYSNYFVPLGKVENLEKEYMDVTEADYDSVVYGLPSRLNSLGVIYNKKVLKEAGVEAMPTTMEEMEVALKKVKDNTDAIPYYTNYNTILGIWGGALTSFGGEQYRLKTLKAGTAFKEGQPMREIMDFIYYVSSNGLIEEDPITGDIAKSLQMLADGKVAMIVSGSQDVPTIENMNSDKDNIAIAPFPVKLNGDNAIAYGADSVVGINKNSRNIETAKAFLEFFISSESGYAEESNGISPKNQILQMNKRKYLEKIKLF
ncbi:ABC transporter substrate-binding protein [[Clostridium] dakarense]|uniref:ABC transporter substrate-binding protein n=1 Tax=Faecalimicrobium dakarense TaxID=1301100 RepID=UPI0004B2B6F3|nr:ABC transporter substrate-binding protein [[Clostridium] dakarense]